MRLVELSCVLLVVSSVCFCATNDTSVEEKEDEVEKEQTFEEYENGLKKGASNLIRKLLPQMMKGASGATISGPCMSSVMRIIGGVRQLREWALRFVDATGKLPSGILEGTSLSLGDYDECLDIKVGRKDNPPKSPEDTLFVGKYCLLESHRSKTLQRAVNDYYNGNKDAPIAKTKTVLNLLVKYKYLSNNTMKVGVCVPSTCTTEDLGNILKSDALKFIGEVSLAYCKTGEEEVATSTEQYIILALLGLLAGCLLLGTIFDVYQRIRSNTNEMDSKASEKPGITTELARGLSLYSNTLDLLNVDVINEPLRCLCAIRSIAVILTIYSHTYGHIHDLHFQKFSKPANFMRFFNSFTFSGIANGSVSVDTFFFLTGITISYNRWRKATTKGPVNLNIIGLLLQRYFRLSAAQLLVIGLFLLFPLIGSGPLWSAYADTLLENCRQRWWLNILYVLNFWSSKDVCLYHTWVLAVIMQLTLLGAVILLLLKWSPKLGISFCILLTLAGVIGVAVMTVIHDLPGSMAYFMLDLRTAPLVWRRVFIMAYDHVGPFCIGLLTGYFLAVKKNTLNISWRVSALIWCISICCNTSVLFGLYKYRHGDQMGTPLATFYAITHRNVWALGIAWLVIACSTKHGGVVTKILHTRIFAFIDRLCYLAFLLNIPIIFYHSSVIRERWFMGHFELMFFAMGYIGFSFTSSAILYITCVKPFFFVESKIQSCFGTRNKFSFPSRSDSAVPSYKSHNLQLGNVAEGNGHDSARYCQKTDGV